MGKLLRDETGIEMANELRKIALAIGGETSAKTWEDIHILCRNGKHTQALEIGQEFSFNRNGVPVRCAVMGFIEGGRIGSIALKNENLENGVIFQTIDCLYNLQFDEKEAFLACPNGLTAGAYKFLLGSHSWVSADVGKTFYFMLNSAVPEGGQIVFNQSYNVTLEGATVNVYASSTTSTASETATLSSTAIDGATDLGALNNAINGNLNSCQRALLGNNRWKESAIRQHLNSNGVAGSVWSPQNDWDRPPSWVSSTAGFMNGLESKFTDYVAECKVDTYKNTVCDGGGLDTTEEKFFLVGNNEMFFSAEGSDNGIAWDFYKDGSQYSSPNAGDDAIRIKKLNNTATYWWLRSPGVGCAYGARSVNLTGSRDNLNADYSFGVAPAFVIA